MGKGKKKNRYDRIVFWGIILSVGAMALLLWGPFQKMRKAPDRKPPAAGKKLDREGRERVITAVIAVVIDDLGQDLKPAQELLGMPERITLAVMPRLPQSKKIAELALHDGREVLVLDNTARRSSPSSARASIDARGELANDRRAQCTASVIHAGTGTGAPSEEMQW